MFAQRGRINVAFSKDRSTIVTAKLRSGWRKLAIFVVLVVLSLTAFHAPDIRDRVAADAPALALLLAWAKGLSYFMAGVALMHEVDGIATSFADLWGRRWNITMSSVLRAAFYDPAVEGGEPPSPALSAHSLPDVGSDCETEAEADIDADGAAVTPFKSNGVRRRGSAPLQPSPPPSPPASVGAAATGAVVPSRSMSGLSSSWAPSDCGSLASRVSGTGSGNAPSTTSSLRHCNNSYGDVSARSSGNGSAGGTVHDGSGGADDKHDPSRMLQPRAADADLVGKAAAPAGSGVAAGGRAAEASGGGGGRRPSKLRRFLAMLLVFVVSGAWHELVCFTMTRQTSGGSWFLLFVLQAFVLMAESELRKLARAAGFKMPPTAARLLTHGLFLLELCLLWYPPMVKTGMVGDMVRKCDRLATSAGAVAAQARSYLGAVAAVGGLA
ncbi:hypothetical protein GPECTOR_4g660 [Gonium pectorale]|uniref:Wax synthase domain-containing protein n=1 Tax=Gonium pectorale TaxID=33097 RepID=A0A150GXQ5_GONPE|nr:hypothetical protein GPECTOR_4g660 [Gonium pectorale]|eukprot:KXZ54595.1 hypothetical protein GPECTOR_4g660 [Gonium pectorale]